MSDQIIDLNVLVPADKRVSLGDREYRVPGDMPLDTFLRVQKVQQMQDGDDDQTQVLLEMVQAIAALLCWYVPEHDTEARTRAEAALRKLGLSTIIDILGTIYPQDEAPELDEEAAAAVDPPAAGGATTTTPA